MSTYQAIKKYCVKNMMKLEDFNKLSTYKKTWLIATQYLKHKQITALNFFDELNCDIFINTERLNVLADKLYRIYLTNKSTMLNIAIKNAIYYLNSNDTITGMFGLLNVIDELVTLSSPETKKIKKMMNDTFIYN